MITQPVTHHLSAKVTRARVNNQAQNYKAGGNIENKVLSDIMAIRNQEDFLQLQVFILSAVLGFLFLVIFMAVIVLAVLIHRYTLKIQSI